MSSRQASTRSQGNPAPGRNSGGAANFALSPGLVSNQFINYATVEGQKLFKAATKPLKVTFDCAPANLQVFLGQIQDKARIYGWIESLFNIDVNGPKNLLTQYGEIDITEVRQHVETYHNTQTLQAQQSIQLNQCMMNSLSSEALNRVVLQNHKYMVDNIPSGALLFKVIVGIAHIETAATVNHLRQKLSGLDALMSTVNSDIEKFNGSVHLWVKSLRARGHEHNGLVTNLFDGYTAASDRQFVEYIRKKEDAFEEGQDIDPDQLMQMALNKYRILVDKGQWNAPSEEQQKIFILQAELEKLKKKKKSPSTSTGQTATNNNADNKPKKQKGKKEKPAWMLIKPKDSEPQEKIVDSKQYYWCPNHNSWTRHHPSECRGVGKEPTTTTNSQPANSNKALKLAKAFANVATQDKDGE